ncbi:origin recognition complex subunit 6-like [Nannochloropsis oceanica]
MSAGGGLARVEAPSTAPAGPTTQVECLLLRLGGNFPAEVGRLANQLLRKLAVKCKPGSLGKFEVCRPAVCVELACRQCGYLSVSRDSLVQQSMVKEAMYRDVFRRVEQALSLTSAWSVPQLAMVLGGEQAVKLAECILSEYQKRYNNSLQDGGRGGGQARPFAQQSLYVVAAFFLATKKLKIKIDKKKLLDRASAPTQELTAVCTSMQEMCADLVGPSTTGGRRSSIISIDRSAPSSYSYSNSSAKTKKRGVAGEERRGEDEFLVFQNQSQDSAARQSQQSSSLVPSEASVTSSSFHSSRAAVDVVGGSAQKWARLSPSTTIRPPAPALEGTAAPALQVRAISILNPSTVVVPPRRLSFKNEEEKSIYEQWKRTVLAAAIKKSRQSVVGNGVVKESNIPTSTSQQQHSKKKQV